MYQTLCVSLYESISEQLWHRDLETASNSVYSPSGTMALILYLCLQVMHLTESMCPCVFSSILLFLCLCAFLYFFPLVLDIFVDISDSQPLCHCVYVYSSLFLSVYEFLHLAGSSSANASQFWDDHFCLCISPSLCVSFSVCLFLCP